MSSRWHIGFNMLALWVLGPQLELAFGRVRFLALYFVSRAGRLGRWCSGPGRVHRPTLGASGAIFGLHGRPARWWRCKVGGDVRGIVDLDRASTS